MHVDKHSTQTQDFERIWPNRVSHLVRYNDYHPGPLARILKISCPRIPKSSLRLQFLTADNERNWFGLFSRKIGLLNWEKIVRTVIRDWQLKQVEHVHSNILCLSSVSQGRVLYAYSTLINTALIRLISSINKFHFEIGIFKLFADVRMKCTKHIRLWSFLNAIVNLISEFADSQIKSNSEKAVFQNIITWGMSFGAIETPT